MVVAILLLTYMTSILSTFAAPKHESLRAHVAEFYGQLDS